MFSRLSCVFSFSVFVFLLVNVRCNVVMLLVLCFSGLLCKFSVFGCNLVGSVCNYLLCNWFRCKLLCSWCGNQVFLFLFSWICSLFCILFRLGSGQVCGVCISSVVELLLLSIWCGFSQLLLGVRWIVQFVCRCRVCGVLGRCWVFGNQ